MCDVFHPRSGDLGRPVLDHDRLGDLVVNSHAIRIPEHVRESEQAGRESGGVSPGPLERHEPAHRFPVQAHDPETEQSLSGGESVGPGENRREVQRTPTEREPELVRRLDDPSEETTPFAGDGRGPTGLRQVCALFAEVVLEPFDPRDQPFDRVA